jgi:hypothetical protein
MPVGPPVVRSVVPASALTSVPAQVTVHGEGFAAGATVLIGGTRATVVHATDTSILVTTPLHAAGIVDLVVRNPDGREDRLTRGFAFLDVPSTVPTIEGMSPAIGVTTGGTSVQVRGTGLDASTSVTVDGVVVRAFFWLGTLGFTTPPHAAGAVDIVVTNPAGEARLTRGYTFAPPSAFDFNGTWKGMADGPPETLVDMSFTIAGNRLIRITCGSVILTIADGSAVTDGAFSFSVDSGVRLAGRILSADAAVGEINVPPCGPTWYASKQ